MKRNHSYWDHIIEQILNTGGRRFFDETYARRGRSQAGRGDHLESLVLVLDATGQLSRYLQPGLSPSDAVRIVAEANAGAAERRRLAS